MGDIYETHAPVQFSATSDQPILEPEPMEGSGPIIPPVKETVDRWRKEVIEKIDDLRKKIEQSHLENKTLTLEINRLKVELAASQDKINEFQNQITETREIVINALTEVNQALETGPKQPDKTEKESSPPFFRDPDLKSALSEW